mmetsp:Transcript_10499/g.18550  ORF Transcript_10499/g.18550 Transcript_10499/m.18550 type:complete len:458 (-) Transcript_10499:56-1429(-)
MTQVVRVLYDFVGDPGDGVQLSVVQGQELLYLGETVGGWTTCAHLDNSVQGAVPTSYLSSPQPQVKPQYPSHDTPIQNQLPPPPPQLAEQVLLQHTSPQSSDALNKYAKMLKAGLPQGAVAQAAIKDGVTLPDNFFTSGGGPSQPLNTPQASPVSSGNNALLAGIQNFAKNKLKSTDASSESTSSASETSSPSIASGITGFDRSKLRSSSQNHQTSVAPPTNSPQSSMMEAIQAKALARKKHQVEALRLLEESKGITSNTSSAPSWTKDNTLPKEKSKEDPKPLLQPVKQSTKIDAVPTQQVPPLAAPSSTMPDPESSPQCMNVVSPKLPREPSPLSGPPVNSLQDSSTSTAPSKPPPQARVNTAEPAGPVQRAQGGQADQKNEMRPAREAPKIQSRAAPTRPAPKRAVPNREPPRRTKPSQSPMVRAAPSTLAALAPTVSAPSRKAPSRRPPPPRA